MTHPIEHLDLETPEVDAAEQAVAAVPSWQDDEWEEIPVVADANEWDAQEQGRTVAFDDDYR
ncbi:hypothetical protein AB0C07_13085 [Actinoplanes missouriensis]|uniref:hypothetical protein n=1 Tax=Actinoplanes missouriensis TaxID=1866 RepID=UPI0034007EC7